MRRSAQFRFIAFVALAIAVAPLARSAGAQEAKDDNKAMDAVLAKSVFETIKLGFPLYNAGDQAGCYRVYEGALTALVPTLGYRPDLQTEIKQGLNSIAALRTPGDRAFALRKLLDKSYNVLAHRTLWNRLGGEPAVTAVVHDLVLVAAKDPKVDFTRGGKYKPDLPKLERLVVEFVSSATGGPLKYQGRDMKTSHEGMGITEAQFNAFAADLIAVLKKYKVQDAEINELVGIVATTQGAIVGSGSPAPAVAKKSLWDRLGGEPAVTAVVHDLVLLAATDPKVDFTRGGKYKPDLPKLERLVVEFVSTATGGPLKYEGRDMKMSHEGMGITEAQFNAFADDLVTVLKKYKVPPAEIEELVGIVATTKPAIVEEQK